MHIQLTDVLTCSRCGPAHGLILLADRIEERRVLDGRLGCPNCQGGFPIRGGFADLRAEPPAAEAPPAPLQDAADETESFRLGALLGVTEGPARILLCGEAAAHARRLAALIPDIEVVAAAADTAGWPEEPGISRLDPGSGLPLYDTSVQGVALAGTAGEALIPEAVRVLAPLGRLVLLHASAGAADRIAATRLRLLAHEGGTLVAAWLG
jgi:hypothetical protein